MTGGITGMAAFIGLSALDVPVPDTAQGIATEPARTETAQDASAPAALTRKRLPGAGGRDFATLDAYLDYLRTSAAPMDRPWYREVRPDLFKLETGNLRSSAPPRLVTRDQLERQFGFNR